MLRPVSVLVVMLALAITPVRAQAPVVSGMQTVTGSPGYQYQVPASWTAVPSTILHRTGDQSISIDAAMVSTDGSQRAHLEVASGFGVTSDHVVDVLGAFLGLGLGGPSAGLPPVAALAGPDPVQVDNADAAVSGAAVFLDPNGSPRVMAARIAIRGGTTYLLALDITEDFYQSDPTFAAIMNSLQLTNP
jgi:hypothetical protein